MVGDVVQCFCGNDDAFFFFSLGLSRLITKVSFISLFIFSVRCMDKPDKVVNPARGQLNRENEYFSVPVRT